MKIASMGVVLALGLGLTACAGSDERLDTQGGKYPLACLDHQKGRPGASYAPGADSDRTLELLRYYTANAAVAYCDGKPATDADRRWATRYVLLGADPANVRHITG